MSSCYVASSCAAVQRFETDQLQVFDVSPTTISLIVFASVFGGSMLGMAVRRRLPKHHLTDDSKGVVQLFPVSTSWTV